MKYLSLVLLTLGVAATAHAQPESAYYGVALGTFEYDESDFTGDPIVRDETGSYRLLVGYQFMEHLAVEGGYGQTKTLNGGVTLGIPGGAIDLGLTYRFKILTVRLVGVLPFDNGISLLGGLGYSDMRVKYSLTDGVNTASESETINEPGYYFGVQYDWDRVGVRLGHEKFDFDGGAFSDDVDASETSISFFYRL